MSGFRRPALVGVLLVAAAVPAAAQRQNVTGCWTVQVGAWEPPLETSDPGFPPPAWFELRGRRGGGEGPAIYGGSWSRRERHWKWTHLRGGGVAIVFSTGFAGYHLRLDTGGERLEGRIEAFTQGLGLRHPRAPVTATRGPCPKGGG